MPGRRNPRRHRVPPTSPLEPTLDHMVRRVNCPTWSLDRFLLQGLPSETRWLPGQRSVGGARPELVRYHLFFRPTVGRASGVGARCWGTQVEIGCLLTYCQLISGCRAVLNLSPMGALFLFHDVRLYDPERRLVRAPPRSRSVWECLRETNKGESGFCIANNRDTVAEGEGGGEKFNHGS